MLDALHVAPEGLEAARRAWVKWDAEDTKRWLMNSPHWRLTADEAQRLTGEALSDLGGQTGTGQATDIVLAAYHTATAPRWERMLEAMRWAPGCDNYHEHPGLDSTHCDACWASMVDAARQEWNRP